KNQLFDQMQLKAKELRNLHEYLYNNFDVKEEELSVLLHVAFFIENQLEQFVPPEYPTPIYNTRPKREHSQALEEAWRWAIEVMGDPSMLTTQHHQVFDLIHNLTHALRDKECQVHALHTRLEEANKVIREKK